MIPNQAADLDDILAFDPLQYAEDLTGRSMHDDDTVGLLGMLIAGEHAAAKNHQLQMMDDTVLQNDLDRYTRIITEMGFEQVLDLPFTAPGWYPDDPPRSEHYYIYAHRDGLLLSFDTYDGVRVNGGKVYYCWVPNDADKYYSYTSSGGFRRFDPETGDTPATRREADYWAGDHDCREALRHNVNKLRAGGTFLPQWPAGNKLFLWLLHYQDTKTPGYDYQAIGQERINMLPDWVRTMIDR
jgi:hypothetical protein